MADDHDVPTVTRGEAIFVKHLRNDPARIFAACNYLKTLGYTAETVTFAAIMDAVRRVSFPNA